MKMAQLLGAMALTTLLMSCHQRQDISFDGRSVTLHAAGEPAATITSRGSFSVGSKLVDISPAQRHSLIRFYDDIVAIHEDTGGKPTDGKDGASQLCQEVEQVKQLQATLATNINAFTPYAGLDPAPGAHCDSASSLVTS